ncbi:MAG: hypothetical protein QOI80_2701, partial [Solirubrobacteraceae bacterium]|nr:hypothetical protein [Solirubrobacteraceae bacterium]
MAFLVSAPAASAATTERLPEGSTIAGIAVGGLGPNGARAELRRQLAPVYESPIEVRIHGRRVSKRTAALGQDIRYDDMVAAAYEQFDRGDPVHVRMMRTIDGSLLTAAVSDLARPFRRTARNARVHFGLTHVARFR